MTTAVSDRGQVTIPKRVRDQLGIRPGTVLAFAAVNGKLVAEKEQAGDLFAKWRGRGRLPGRLSVDAYLRKVRDGDRR